MSIFASVDANLRAGRAFALATVISSADSTPRDSGARMLLYPDGSSEGTIGGGPLEANVIIEGKKLLARGESAKLALNLTPEELGMRCGGSVEIFVEVFRAQACIHILGAGHIGEKLARLAELLDLAHTITDDRRDFAVPEKYPAARAVRAVPLGAVFAGLAVGADDAIIIVTRCHQHDEVCLRQALTTPAGYIGMIGSRDKVRETLGNLARDGIAVRDSRLYAPVGLTLGDKSPGQIAASIIAEIMAVRAGGALRHRRDAATAPA